jgi:AraC family transcriptional activator of mtrCDE
MPSRPIDEVDMENTHDWLSRLLEMIPVKGTLDFRCFLGAPWRIDFAASELGEIPYHVILGGSAVLQDPEGGSGANLTRGVTTGDSHTIATGARIIGTIRTVPRSTGS